ncbi:MAG: hypothetical protein INR70_00465 [Parafilimonas terrae]|nr:hypothetical protein [Parafilimonas terrae]
MPMYRAQRGIDTRQIEDGFSSLAKVFAPPSPQEMLAGAKTREIAAQQGRISELYAMAKDPNFQREVFDRMAVAAGSYTPNQSYYSVDTADRRSGLNNAADNARALQQTGMQQRGETERALLAPVGQGATRFVPDAIAKMFGVPQTQTGVVELNQGQTATLPDGRTLAGSEKPMSSDEVKARVLGGMPLEQQRAAAFGTTPLQTVMGPDGPTLTTGPEAIGRTPAPAQQAPSSLARLQAERAGLPAGDPRRAEYDSAIAAEGRGAVADPFRNQADTDAAKAYGEMAKGGLRARSFGSDIDMLDALLVDTPTGATAETRLRVAGYAKELGLDEVANGLTGGKMDRLTAANAIAQRIAPALRVPGSGAQSDRELTNFLASLPSILNTPGGNRLILETLRGGAQYQQAVGDIAARALRGEISRADADAQIAATQTPFARFSAVDRGGPAGTGAPAASTAQAGGYSEGTIIENDAGARMIRRSGKWEPYNG